MGKLYKLTIILFLLFFSSQNIFSQGSNCAGMTPFCSDSGAEFPASFTGTGAGNGPQAEPGNSYSCAPNANNGGSSTLFTTPSPAWYYIEVDPLQPGDFILSIDADFDIDFAAYGPYADLATAQGNCGSLFPAVDCSYDPQSTEVVTLPFGGGGQVFVFMITNFANVQNFVTVTQIGGSGLTDCSIVDPPTCPDDVIVTAGGPYTCDDASSYSITTNVTGPDAPYTDGSVQITGAGVVDLGNGTANFFPDQAGPGVHVIAAEYIDPVLGCSVFGTTTITVTSPFVADFSLPQLACTEDGNVQAQLQGTSGGTWSISGGGSIDQSGSIDVSGLSNGTVMNVTYTVGPGGTCQDTHTLSLVALGQPVLNSTTIPNCLDPTTGEAQVTLAGLSSTLIVSQNGPGSSSGNTWYSDATLTSPLPNQFVHTITGNETIYLEVINEHSSTFSCSSSVAVDLTIIQPPTYNVPPLQECENPVGSNEATFNLFVGLSSYFTNPSYYTDANATNPISNPFGYAAADGTVIYVEDTYDNSVSPPCTAIVPVTLDVITSAPQSESITICESAVGAGATYDFTQVESTLITNAGGSGTVNWTSTNGQDQTNYMVFSAPATESLVAQVTGTSSGCDVTFNVTLNVTAAMVCDDNDCSNGLETWNATTCSCDSGTPPPPCDDGCQYTDDTFDSNCDCVFTPNPPVCDDNDCDTSDAYDDSICDCTFTAIPPPDCDDNDCNTNDSYDSVNCVCVNDPIPPPNCDDNDCNTNDSYDSVNCVCVNDPIPPPNCDDNDCNTADVYNTVTCLCENNPITPSACDDNDCNTDDSYDVASCTCINTPIPPPNCDDNDCSTNDSYDSVNCVCVNDPIPPPNCDDNDCSTDDSYDASTCTCINTPNPPICDDGCQYTDDSYDTVTCDCVFTPNPPVCNDNDCNTDDVYDPSICDCVFTPIPPPNCDDNDCSTDDSYDASTCTCVNTPNPPICDDGCQYTDDSYDTVTCDCVFIPNPPVCNDSDCNTDDVYDPNICDCVFTPIPPPSCDDNDCNTDDSYDAVNCICVNTPIPPPNCNDNDCNTDDSYDSVNCICVNAPIPPPDCDDNDCNTDDSYDAVNCICVNTLIPPPICDDNDCNTDDSYDAASCSCVFTPIPPPSCDDGNCLTIDSYNSATCECEYIIFTPISVVLVNDDCLPSNTEYSIQFQVSGGTGSYIIVGGATTNLGGGLYEAGPFASGSSYSFDIIDGTDCAPVPFAGSQNCSCTTQAGTMGTPLNECADAGASVTATYDSSTEVNDGNDVGIFVLHDNSGNTLGTQLGSNTTGTFTYGGAITPGQTYYISYVLGNDNGGTPDLNDPCLSVAAGQPVVFNAPPTVDAGTPDNTCGLSYDLIGSNDIGTGTWTFTGPSPGATANFINANSANTSVTVSESGAYTFTWTVTNGACTQDASVTVNFDTPTISSFPSNQDACGGESINLVPVIDNPFGVDITYQWTSTGTQGGGSGTTFNASESPGGCIPQTVDYTLTIFCTNDLFTPLGTETVSITYYPMITSVAPIGGCSVEVQGNCIDGGILTILYDDGSGTYTATPTPNPANGDMLDWAAFTPGSPDLDGDGIGDCAQMGTTTAVCTGCPTVTTPTNGIEDLCVGASGINFTNYENITVIDDPNGQFLGFTWYNDAALTLPINPATYTTINNDPCNVSTNNLYLGLICASSPIPIAAGSIIINVYPDYDASQLQGTNLDCTVPTVVPLCPNYVVTPVSVPVIVNPGESGTASWSITYNGVLSCFTETYELPYSCPGLECPVVTATLTESVDICSGGTIDLTTYEAGSIFYNDPDGTFAGYAWFTDAGLTIPYLNGPFFHSFLDNCNTESQTLYVGVLCSESVNAIPAGELTVNIYPDYDVNLMIETSVECAVPTLVSSCTNYQITPISVPLSVNPGESGTATWEITFDNGLNPLSCWVESYNINYDCPQSLCPVVTFPLSQSLDICSGDLVGETTYEPNIQYNDPDLTFAGFGWYSDASLTTPFNSASVIHSGIDNCNTESFTAYVGLLCSDGSAPIAAGQLDIIVYPNYDATLLQQSPGDCVASTLTSICPNYVLTPDPSNVSVVNPGDSGSNNWTVTFNNGPTGNSCFTQAVSVPYTCQACPQVSITQSAPFEACNGDNIMLSAEVIPSSAILNFDYSVQWYENGLPINGAIDLTYDFVSNATGCDAVINSYTLELTCIIPGGAPESIDAGTLTTYPDFDNSTITTIEGDCNVLPSVTSSCFTYLITPVAGTVPTEINANESGIAMWQVSFPGTSCWSPETIDVPYNCEIEECPTANITQNTPFEACNGDMINIEIEITPNTANFGDEYEFVWLLNGSPLLGENSPTLSYEAQALGCETENLEFVLEFTCIDPGDIPELLIFNPVTVYPDFDDTFITTTNDVCTIPTISSSCNNYQITEILVPISVNEGDNGTASWNVSYNGSNCWSETIEVSYDCPLNPVCPTIDTPIDATGEMCEGDIFDLSIFDNQIGITDNDLTAGDIIWYTDIGLTSSATNADFVSQNICNPTSLTFYAGLECTIDGSILPAGSAEITLYPDFALIQIITTQGDCDNLPTLISTCNNYVVTPNPSNVTVIDGGDIGTSEWTITYNDGPNGSSCFSESLTVGYACDAICPTLSILQFPPPFVCSNSTLTIEAEIVPNTAILNQDYTIQWQNQGTDIAGANGLIYSVIQTGIDCTSDPANYSVTITCISTGESQNIDAGNVTIVNDYNPNLMTETVSECNVPELTTSCPDYVVTPISVPTEVLAGESGTAIFEITNALSNCWTETYEIDYSCPPAPVCPTVTTPVNDVLTICDGDAVDLSNFENQVVINDPDGTFITYNWYSDVGLNNLASNADLTHNGIDNCNAITNTLYLGISCSEDPVIIAAGSIDLTIFPMFDVALLQSTPGDCAAPELNTSCANYILTPDPNNVTSVNPGESGTSNWTITFNDGINENSCFSESFEVAYACGAVCPIATIQNAAPAFACNGDGFTISANVTPSTAVLNTDFSVQWQLNGSDIVGENGLTLNTTVNNNGCETIDNNYTLVFTCLIPGDAPQTLDAGTTTIYPDFDASTMIETNPNCTVPSLTSTCVNYDITPINVPISVNQGDNGVSEWSVSYSGSNCWTETIFINYDCPLIPLCPTIDSPLDTTRTICSGGALNIVALAAQIIINDPDLVAGDIEWFTDAGLTNLADFAQISTNAGPNNCDLKTVMVFAGLNCVLDGSVIPAGSLEINVLPNFDQSLLSSTNVACQIPTLTSTCANYQITEINVPATVIAGDSGIAEWEITYSNNISCWTESFTLPYDCPLNPICPIVDTQANGTQDICSGESIDINNWEAQISFTDTDNTATGISWFTDASLTTPASFTLTHSGVDNCEPENITLFAGLGCSIDGSVISAGQAVITVYPDFDNNFIIETTNECQVAQISSVCDNYIITEVGIHPIEVNLGDSGTLEWEITYDDATNCFTQPYSISYTCPEIPEVGNIAIPTAFSPNGDGVNDMFRAIGTNIAEFEMRVYDRWGMMLYTTNDIMFGWDGLYPNGTEAEMGVYVFIITGKYEDATQGDIFEKGNVTLIR